MVDMRTELVDSCNGRSTATSSPSVSRSSASASHVEEVGFGGFWHPGIGQEGLQVGAVAAMGPDDYLYYAHRGLGYAYREGNGPGGSLRGPAWSQPRQHAAARVAEPSTSPTRHSASWVRAARWGRASSWGPAPPPPRSSSATAGSPWCSSGTVPPAAAPGTRPHSRPRCGSCPSCGSARTTAGPCLRASRTRARPRNIADRAAAYGMPGVIVDGQDADGGPDATTEAVDRAREARARR